MWGCGVVEGGLCYNGNPGEECFQVVGQSQCKGTWASCGGRVGAVREVITL